ncbi:unnamed protein product, partial [Oppiella nova]
MPQMDSIVRDETEGIGDESRVGPNLHHLRSDSDNSVNRSLSLWQKLSDAALRLGDDNQFTSGNNSCQPSPQSSSLKSTTVSVINQDIKDNELERQIHPNLW